jgi:hypothetical protein
MATLCATLPVVALSCNVDDSEPFRLYTKLESGEKRYEVRLLLAETSFVDGVKEVPSKWWSVRPGTYSEATLKVTCASDPQRSFTRKVVGGVERIGYQAVLEAAGVQRCVPGALSVHDAIERVYRRFYPAHLEGYPVLAIELGELVRTV